MRKYIIFGLYLIFFLAMCEFAFSAPGGSGGGIDHPRRHEHRTTDNSGAIRSDQDIKTTGTATDTVTCTIENSAGSITCIGGASFATGAITGVLTTGEAWVPYDGKIGFDNATRTMYFRVETASPTYLELEGVGVFQQHGDIMLDGNLGLLEGQYVNLNWGTGTKQFYTDSDEIIFLINTGDSVTFQENLVEFLKLNRTTTTFTTDATSETSWTNDMDTVDSGIGVLDQCEGVTTGTCHFISVDPAVVTTGYALVVGATGVPVFSVNSNGDVFASGTLSGTTGSYTNVFATDVFVNDTVYSQTSQADNFTATNSAATSTFAGNVKIDGVLTGGSPVEVHGGLLVYDGINADTVDATSTVTAGGFNTAGNATAAFFFGDGSGLTGLAASGLQSVLLIDNSATETFSVSASAATSVIYIDNASPDTVGTARGLTINLLSALNESTALYVKTVGTGNAGYFYAQNAANNDHAIYGKSNGTGATVYGESDGASSGNAAGDFYISNAANPYFALRGYTSGIGPAVRGTIDYGSNAAAVFHGTTAGTGNILYGNHTGASGNLLELDDNSVDAFVVDHDGDITATRTLMLKPGNVQKFYVDLNGNETLAGYASASQFVGNKDFSATTGSIASFNMVGANGNDDIALVVTETGDSGYGASITANGTGTTALSIVNQSGAGGYGISVSSDNAAFSGALIYGENANTTGTDVEFTEWEISSAGVFTGTGITIGANAGITQCVVQNVVDSMCISGGVIIKYSAASTTCAGSCP